MGPVAEVQVKPWPSEELEEEANPPGCPLLAVAHGWAVALADGWEEALAASLLEVQDCAL